MTNIFDLKRTTIIDLTHSLEPNIPTWSGENEFEHKNVEYYTKGFLNQVLTIPLGIGTHIDLPAHISSRYKYQGSYDVSTFIAPAYVLDVSRRANEKYLISTKDIENFESFEGKIPPHSIFIAYTGWSKFWNDPQKYCNKNSDGIRHFPSFSIEACELLVERNIQGLGIDALSPDSSDPRFPAHQLMLQNNKFIIENLANCDKLPHKGAWVFILPMNIKYASEAPVRAIGIIQQ